MEVIIKKLNKKWVIGLKIGPDEAPADQDIQKFKGKILDWSVNEEFSNLLGGTIAVNFILKNKHDDGEITHVYYLKMKNTLLGIDEPLLKIKIKNKEF